MPLRSASFDEMTIDDEAAFAEVELYHRLKGALRASGHRFLIPTPAATASWDRVLFLNLTFWSGADVVCDDHVAADVIAHAAWHHLVGQALASTGGARPSADALLFGESIASAFDLYLVGRLLVSAPESDFITTQVSIMGEAALEDGLSEPAFAALLTEVCRDPELAFEQLRELLFDAGTRLLRCATPAAAIVVLEGFRDHRFHPLLHHYQLSNWILYARAYGDQQATVPEPVREVDTALRDAPSALLWLAEHWMDGLF